MEFIYIFGTMIFMVQVSVNITVQVVYSVSVLQGDVNIVASFDRRGEYIYTGNSRGKVLIMTCPELKIKTSFRIGQGTTSAAAVKSIDFARRTE